MSRKRTSQLYLQKMESGIKPGSIFLEIGRNTFLFRPIFHGQDKINASTFAEVIRLYKDRNTHSSSFKIGNQ